MRLPVRYTIYQALPFAPPCYGHTIGIRESRKSDISQRELSNNHDPILEAPLEIKRNGGGASAFFNDLFQSHTNAIGESASVLFAQHECRRSGNEKVTSKVTVIQGMSGIDRECKWR
jgi:hypothetical protein